MPQYAAEKETNKMPKITIISPKEGKQILSDNITILVNITNFDLVNKLGQPNVPGEGHIHYYIDVPIPTIAGKPATTAAETFAPTINTTFTWKNVEPGKHNLSVQLVNNDHTPIVPLVFGRANVTVTAPTLKTMGIDNVVVGLVAKGIEFNSSKVTVPAGSNITLNFDNQDLNIPHNVAIYTDNFAKTTIFKGKVVTGPAKIAYNFSAPTTPGTYFFRCDIHPQMNGQFIVQ
jgi:plastocyanin